MPKDPKRNIQNYQLRGGHLNEYDFQKGQNELAQESELPFTNETYKPGPAQATRRVTEVAVRAHDKVEKRKKRGLTKAGARTSSAARKKSTKVAAKKVAARKSKKATTRTGTKKRASVKNTSRKTAAKRKS